MNVTSKLKDVKILLLMVENTKLTKLIKRQGVTKQSLADSMGIVRSTLHNWEKGLSSPTYDDLEKMSKFLNVPIKELGFSGAENELEESNKDIDLDELRQVWNNLLQSKDDVISAKEGTILAIQKTVEKLEGWLKDKDEIINILKSSAK